MGELLQHFASTFDLTSACSSFLNSLSQKHDPMVPRPSDYLPHSTYFFFPQMIIDQTYDSGVPRYPDLVETKSQTKAVNHIHTK